MSAPAAAASHCAGLGFDTLAEQYDDIFTHSLIGRAQRQAVWDVMSETFRSGDHILELNCGTGEDALQLARLGVSVFACDASERMVQVANRRRSVEAPGSPIRFEVLPAEQIAEARLFGPYDGVFSNFAGLNCVADIADVARQLAALVSPGAPLLICLASRICLWETLWFLTRREPGRAFRRWKGQAMANLGEVTISVQYPTLRRLRKMFAPFFILRSWTGIGVAVPPSYLEHLAARHRKIFDCLRAIDSRISVWPGFRVIGDHVLLLFERASS